MKIYAVPVALAIALAVVMVSHFAQADPLSDCLNRCRQLAKGAQAGCAAKCPPPGGGVVPPQTRWCKKEGKKIPSNEWSAARCNDREKPPEQWCAKEKKSILKAEWTAERCNKKDNPDGNKCGNGKHDEGGTCVCDDSTMEIYPQPSGPCVPKCDLNAGEIRGPDGACKKVGACMDPCAHAAAQRLDTMEEEFKGYLGSLEFWLQLIWLKLLLILLTLLAWMFGAKKWIDDRRERKLKQAMSRRGGHDWEPPHGHEHQIPNGPVGGRPDWDQGGFPGHTQFEEQEPFGSPYGDDQGGDEQEPQDGGGGRRRRDY